MTKSKKIVTIIAVVLVIALTSIVAFAVTNHKNPAEVAAALTGKSVSEVNKERQSGKTYGAIANESGKLDEFKNEMDQNNCNGTCNGSGNGTCDGSGNGTCNGSGNGTCTGSGNGHDSGHSNGSGNCQGECLN